MKTKKNNKKTLRGVQPNKNGFKWGAREICICTKEVETNGDRSMDIQPFIR